MLYFKLKKDFIDEYREKPSPFKNALAATTFYRTYSRIKEDGTKEDWVDCVQRVVEGIYSFQLRHYNHLRLFWEEDEKNKKAEKMFDLIYNMKFLPPGRMLWLCAPDGFITETNDSTALFNCAFVSTKDMDKDPVEPFIFAMNSLFLGSGQGFSLDGAGKIEIKKPKGKINFTIEDCRESWIDSLAILLKAYFLGEPEPIFDYSKIRPAGIPLKRFGGVSSGFGPLKEMHDDIVKLLNNRIGKKITSVNIVDIMNLIGRCIVAGSVRRSAEVAIGEADDEEFLEMKDFNKFPEETQKWRWMSNNTIKAKVGETDYSKILGSEGEKYGLCWLQTTRDYSRLADGPDYIDKDVEGFNPCLEQGLLSHEMCGLSEIMLHNISSYEEFLEAAENAYLVAKTVSLLPTSNPKTNEVQMKNRRLGVSVTGIQECVNKNGLKTVIDWFDSIYKELKYKIDKKYSEEFKIGLSNKITTVKPSGSVSLVAGTGCPGVHFPEAEYYLRRVRIGVFDPILKRLDEAGYKIDDEIYGGEDSKKLQKVVSFPMKENNFERSKKDVSIWEQLKIVSTMQKFWSANAVSCTVTYKQEEEKDIPRAIEYFERDLKTVSFLPLSTHGFDLAPYEAISKEQYEQEIKDLKEVDFSDLIADDAKGTRFCDNESCEIL